MAMPLFIQWVPGYQDPCPSLHVSSFCLVLLGALGIPWMSISCLVGETAHCCTVHSLLSLISGTGFQLHSVWHCAQRGSSISQLSTKHREARRLTYSQRYLKWKYHREVLGKLCLGAVPGGSSGRFSCCLLGMGTPCWTSASFLSYDSFGGWKPFSEAGQSSRQASSWLPEASVNLQLQPRCLFSTSMWEINSSDWIIVGLCFFCRMCYRQLAFL